MRVLVLHAAATARELIVDTVRAAGHEPLVAEDGDAAWATFQHAQPPLVVLDVAAPGLDAVEVCHRIRAFEMDGGAEAFVLVAATREQPERLARALVAGADDYMVAPLTAGGVRARLAIAVRRIDDAARRHHAEASLARARWLAGIGETTLAVQHEVNNPLAVLLGHAALLDEDVLSADDTKESVRVIVEQARRIADVVRRLAELRDPRTVEYASGTRMLDLHDDDAPRRDPAAPHERDDPPADPAR